MKMKLSPLIIFLMLLFFLILSIAFQNSFVFSKLEGYTDKITTYSNIVNGIKSSSSTSKSSSTVSPLNIETVYDSCGNKVDSPKNGTIYYDSSGNVVNFPKGIVYDEIGNYLNTPPLVGFMLDSLGNPIDLPLYDSDGNIIKDLSNFTGGVYDSYHNQIQFPYFDSNGNYVVSPVMTPSIYKSYLSYLDNSTKSSNYSDLSFCKYGCLNHDISLDDYISLYYQNFWNKYQEIYSDDYVLKSSIVSNCDAKSDRDDWHPLISTLNSLGSDLKTVVNTIGKDTQAVATTVGKDTQAALSAVGENTQDVSTTVGKDTQAALSATGENTQDVSTTVGKDTQAALSATGENTQDVLSAVGKNTQAVLSATGENIESVGGAVGSGLGSLLHANPTKIYGADDSVRNGNGRGLAGNYNGDNGISNQGYLKNTNMFSNYAPGEVANFNNNYNATPLKGPETNFMPITADFSKFGR